MYVVPVVVNSMLLRGVSLCIVIVAAIRNPIVLSYFAKPV